MINHTSLTEHRLGVLQRYFPGFCVKSLWNAKDFVGLAHSALTGGQFRWIFFSV